MDESPFVSDEEATDGDKALANASEIILGLNAGEEGAEDQDAPYEEAMTTVFSTCRSSLPEDELDDAWTANDPEVQDPETGSESEEDPTPTELGQEESLVPEPEIAPPVEPEVAQPAEVVRLERPTEDVAAGAPEAPTPNPTARKVRVLAAEDNKTNQLVLKRLLKTLEIDLEIVENGMLAVDRYKEAQPDLILTDISMPVMDGKAAARAIRSYEAAEGLPKVPIVAMTAHAVTGDEQEILAAGVDFYMTKPLRKDALIQHILAAAPEDAHPPLPPG